MTNKTIYLPGLNGLRAIAAITVLISHLFFEIFGTWGIKGLNLPLFRIARLSYEKFEKPFLKLKNRFAVVDSKNSKL